MKTKIFIALLCCLNFYMHAQTLDWAPVGAKWYYQETYFGSSDIGYVKIESKKDTTILNHLCKMLALSKPASELVVPFNMDTIFYTYSSNDTIYLYNTLSNAFRPIYINNRNPGDSIIINYEVKDGIGNNANTVVCTYKYIIDSATYTTVNSIPIRQTYLHDINNGIGLTVYENIGNTNIFTLLYPKCTSVVIDGTYYALRCYYHPNYGWFKFRPENCDYITGIKDLAISQNQIYYFNNYLYLHLPTNEFPITISASDILGTEYMKTKIPTPSEKLYLEIPSDKFYIIQIENSNLKKYNLKIIK